MTSHASVDVALSVGAGVAELFEAQAASAPDAVAVRCGTQHVSYGALDACADALAQALRVSDVGPETIVALCVPRSSAAVTGMLGILKAGGAYLPLDPIDPAPRLIHLMEDAQARVLVTDAAHRARLASRLKTIVLEDEDFVAAARGGGARRTHPPRARHPEQLAYVMYTSGSTGQPKGVAVPQRGIVRLVRETDYLPFAADEVYLQLSPMSFDASTFEIWGALLNGATLVLAAPGPPSVADVARLIREEGVTTLWLTAGLFHQCAAAGLGDAASLRHLLAGGDVLSATHVRRFRAQHPACELINGYGPTENTTFSTSHRIDDLPADAASVPIGRPIARTQACVLDAAGERASVGIAGDLLVGGDGLARGYVGQAALTAECFVPDAISGAAGARLYRTGDRARLRSDGVLEFLGRRDGQIKLRGYRIELAEIEMILSRHPSVQQAAVRLWEADGDKRLVAYVVPAAGHTVSSSELRRHLQQQAPAYLVPAAVIELPALPLTPLGKVDRHALPAPPPVRPALEAAYVAPRTPRERTLTGLWAEALRLQRVGVYDPFLELGGHSLTAMQLVARLQDVFGIELSLRAFFDASTIARLADHLDRLPATVAPAPEGPVLVHPRPDRIPLSRSQERVWFLQQMAPDNQAYVFQAALDFRGTLDVRALARSLTEIVRRHEGLRTTYVERDGRPVQIIHEPYGVVLPIVDVDAVSDARRGAIVTRLIAQEIRRPFRLSALPLTRWLFVRRGDAEARLVQVQHHLAHDGWSFNVFVEELLHLYRDAADGRPMTLPEPAIQFADYALWERDFLDGGRLDAQLAFWKHALADCPPLIALPSDRPRPAIPRFRGGLLRRSLPVDLCAGLRALGRTAGASLFMIMLAAFFLLLYRQTGTYDACVGTGFANRRWRRTDRLLGMTVNTVALRVKAGATLTFGNLIDLVKAATLDAHAHQDAPFDAVVDAVRPSRAFGVNPLFQVMFSFHDSPLAPVPVPGLTTTVTEGIGNGSAKFDMNLVVIPNSATRAPLSAEPSPDGITVLWEYNGDLYDRATIERMFERYERLLRAGLDPALPLWQAPLSSDAERRHVMDTWNPSSPSSSPSSSSKEAAEDAAKETARDVGMIELFEAQAVAAPDAVAVRCDAQHVSYGALDARAEALARALREAGVGIETVVGLCLPRSVAVVTGMLGILKAGGVYVPLDPVDPVARVEHLLQDVQARVLVTDAAGRTRLASPLPTIVLEDERLEDEGLLATARDGESVPRPPRARRPAQEQLAYVMYTSGSTGQPKGVAVPQRGIVRLVRETNYLPFAADDIYLQLSPLSFDASTLEIWGALLNGATLVLAASGPPSVADVARVIREEGVTTLWLTAGLFHQCVATGLGDVPSLRRLLSGGDVLSVPHVQRFRAQYPACDLINGYGPTENTTFSTWHRIDFLPADAPSVPIGRPIARTQVYVLDAAGEPAPAGIAGDLLVGGDGLARGYVGRPEWTAARFVPDGVSGASGARLYHTGDRARVRSDGTLEFLGRRDGQVKLRGFRIELGELEAVLSRHATVQQAAVRIWEVDGDKQLVAYVVAAAGQTVSSSALRRDLQQEVPAYLVPAAVIELPALPLTANGKVDRAALPPPTPERPALDQAYVAPRTPLEETLAQLWGDVLRLERVGVADPFFDLGGHSLLATQLVSRLRDTFGVELSLRTFFEAPTIAQLAERVDELLLDRVRQLSDEEVQEWLTRTM